MSLAASIEDAFGVGTTTCPAGRALNASRIRRARGRDVDGDNSRS
jgi:hypothetical protein